MLRKTVTLVFCDVADSTVLGDRLDPEALRDVWSRYHEAARGVLERHGGTVEKFIGDAVMAAFGIPVVHEDDAVRAVRAAAELREELEALNDELERAYGVRLGVRTGVNTGEVIAGDPAQGHAFATGDPVVVAQRLEAAAAGGEILIGDATYRLVRDAVTAEPVAVAAKGKPEPVAAWRLLEVAPGVAGLLRRTDAPLVGREAELARLEVELALVTSGRVCRVLTVVGEPGVGKSRLAAELVGSAGVEATVLEGRCLPYGDGITYWPLVEIVRGLDLAGVLAGQPDGDVVRGRIEEAIGRAEQRSRSDELYSAVRRLLETLARRKPVVLLLDDVQWAEPAFLDLVEYLEGWTRDAAVFVLCLARSEFAEQRPGWAMLPLEPLSADESARLLAELAGPLDPAAMRELRRATGGNPLFLGEMVRMLAEEDRLVESGGRVVADLESLRVPASIHAVLAARLDRLDGEERDLLQRASVIGQTFFWGAVAELTPPERTATVARHLQALVRKGLLRPDAQTLSGEDGFRFAHILVRDAAYDSLAKRLRGELHERYAGWLEAHTPDGIEHDEIVGHHLEQAHAYRLELGRVGEDEATLAGRAAHRLGRAGRRAVVRGDIHAARSLLERAAALLPDSSEERLELAPERGLVLTEAGELAQAEAVLSDLLSRPDGVVPELVRLRARTERVALRLTSDPRGGWEDDLALVEEALPALERGGEPDPSARRTLARAWYLVGLVRGLWAGRYERGEASLERALVHARAAGDRRQEAEIVGRLGFAAFSGPMPIPQAIERCAALLESAAEDAFVEASCRRWLGSLFARQGRFDEARVLIDEASRAFDQLGAKLYAAAAAAFGHGDIHLLAGDAPSAERALRAGYEALERLGEVGYRTSVAAVLSRALHAQGKAEEAERLAAEVEESASEHDIWSQVLYRLTRARLLSDAGAAPEAVTKAQEALAIIARTDLLELHGDTLLVLGDVLRRAGRHDEARAGNWLALELYERKGDVVSAATARAFLAAPITPV